MPPGKNRGVLLTAYGQEMWQNGLQYSQLLCCDWLILPFYKILSNLSVWGWRLLIWSWAGVLWRVNECVCLIEVVSTFTWSWLPRFQIICEPNPQYMSKQLNEQMYVFFFCNTGELTLRMLQFLISGQLLQSFREEGCPLSITLVVSVHLMQQEVALKSV